MHLSAKLRAQDNALLLDGGLRAASEHNSPGVSGKIDRKKTLAEPKEKSNRNIQMQQMLCWWLQMALFVVAITIVAAILDGKTRLPRGHVER